MNSGPEQIDERQKEYMDELNMNDYDQVKSGKILSRKEKV